MTFISTSVLNMKNDVMFGTLVFVRKNILRQNDAGCHINEKDNEIKSYL